MDSCYAVLFKKQCDEKSPYVFSTHVIFFFFKYFRSAAGWKLRIRRVSCTVICLNEFLFPSRCDHLHNSTVLETVTPDNSAKTPEVRPLRWTELTNVCNCDVDMDQFAKYLGQKPGRSESWDARGATAGLL